MHARSCSFLLLSSCLLAGVNAYAQADPEKAEAELAQAAPDLAATGNEIAQAPEPAPPAEPAPEPDVAPAPTEGAPAPAPDQQALATNQAAVEEAPPDAKKIKVGKQGFFQPSALLQGWFWVTQNEDAADNEDWMTRFRIRRAELKIKGEIVPELIAYSVMIDPAKLLAFETEEVGVTPADPADPSPGTVEVPARPRDASILQDFYITFLSEYADVSLGQFKIPVSYEGFNSSSKLLLPERAAVSRAFGDRRDIGIRVEKQFEYFGYVAGVFSGDGLNRLDSNDQKDLALRLETYPMEDLLLGVVGYTSVGERDVVVTTQDRLEGDVKVEIADAIVQAEYIHAWDGPSDARTEGHGMYVAVGYTFLDRVQPLVRVGFLNESFDEQGYDMIYELGLNYYIEGHEAKLQASYSITDATDFAGDDPALIHDVILAAQVSF